MKAAPPLEEVHRFLTSAVCPRVRATGSTDARTSAIYGLTGLALGCNPLFLTCIADATHTRAVRRPECI